MNVRNLKGIMKRLSIIVPMYKVEPYVERCLRSLEKQDIPEDDYEIICINDGSPDKCRDVVMHLQTEFNNIVLIDQENQGVSMARNNGIDKAVGEYLLMVDPDDYIKPDSFRDILEIIEKQDLDIGFTGYIILNESGREEYRYDPLNQNRDVLTGIEYSYKYLVGKSEIRDPHRSWAIFLKTGFIRSNNLKYLPDVPYLEDGELQARMICLAERVLFINNPFYLRTTRPGSATHSPLYRTERARKGFLISAVNLLDFRANICRGESQKNFMNQAIIQFTILYIISLRFIDFITKYRKTRNVLKKGPLHYLDTTNASQFYKKLGNKYNYSLISFYLYWLFMKLKKSILLRLRNIAATRYLILFNT
jgi:glycosyltransferase involved in cell wall biosynthesis